MRVIKEWHAKKHKKNLWARLYAHAYSEDFDSPTGEQLLGWFWHVQEKLETLLAEETALWLKEKKNDPS